MKTLEKTISQDSRLIPFIGNDVVRDSEHGGMISYPSSFRCSGFLMSTDRLVELMSAFSEQIQEAVKSNETD